MVNSNRRKGNRKKETGDRRPETGKGLQGCRVKGNMVAR